MQISWDDLKTVMSVVRHGTLSGAAQELGVNYTTIARRIRRAEETLGLHLFDRLPEGYQPTEPALNIAAHAHQMEMSEHNLMRTLQQAGPPLSGGLTLTAPPLLLTHFLMPVVEAFTDLYPNIDLTVLARNDVLDLTRREADIALRISTSPGDTLKGLRLLEQNTASFANADIANRIAQDPDTMINWVLYTLHAKLPSPLSKAFPNNRIRMYCDDMSTMVSAAQAGLGVVRMPMFIGRSTTGLVQVPVLPPQPYPDIWVVGHADLWASPKLTAFRNVLVTHCKANRALFVA